MRRLKKVSIVLAVLYVLLTLLVYSAQERLIFFPSKMPLNHQYNFCQDFEEFNLNADDGAVLNAVHIKQDSAKGVVLYFHGNSGNISHLMHVANLISSKGYDAIMVDYRTYGKSTGEMSEAAIKSDAQLFYDHALTRYNEGEVILYGRSFGTGVALGLAADNSPNKLILESPFYSAVALGAIRAAASTACFDVNTSASKSPSGASNGTFVILRAGATITSTDGNWASTTRFTALASSKGREISTVVGKMVPSIV